VPVLTHHWEATTKDYRSVKLEVTVENLGTGLALDAHIVAGFDAGERQVWNPEESAHFDLPSGTKRTILLNLTAPRGEHTRIVVQIVHEGYSVDDSYSEWFDT
jgi:hypothetical protein